MSIDHNDNDNKSNSTSSVNTDDFNDDQIDKINHIRHNKIMEIRSGQNQVNQKVFNYLIDVNDNKILKSKSKIVREKERSKSIE